MSVKACGVAAGSITIARPNGLIFSALMLGVAVGCGGDATTADVTGHVTYQGKPVTTGTITFYPSAGRASVGGIQGDGTYQLSGGALVGAHTVTIESFESKGAKPLPTSFEDEMNNPKAMSSGGRAQKIVWLVPEKFASKAVSNLSAQVEGGKTNEINFDL